MVEVFFSLRFLNARRLFEIEMKNAIIFRLSCPEDEIIDIGLVDQAVGVFTIRKSIERIKLKQTKKFEKHEL